MPHGYVKEVARSDARRIVVIVFGARHGYSYPCGPELRWRAACQGRTERWENSAAEESCLQLLIRREARQVNWSGAIRSERDRACDKAAVIPPIEACPRTALAYLILKMGSRVKHFVMVDAERANRVRSCPSATNLRGEESRCNAGEDKQPSKAMEVRYAHAAGKAGNLGVAIQWER
jgi:hypothetical protein